jgi:hypothetical protein
MGSTSIRAGTDWTAKKSPDGICSSGPEACWTGERSPFPAHDIRADRDAARGAVGAGALTAAPSGSSRPYSFDAARAASIIDPRPGASKAARRRITFDLAKKPRCGVRFVGAEALGVDEKAVRGHPLWLYMITAEGTISFPPVHATKTWGRTRSGGGGGAATARPRAVTSRQNATARSTSSAHSAARTRSLPHHRPPVEQRHGITERRVIDRQRARPEKEKAPTRFPLCRG